VHFLDNEESMERSVYSLNLLIRGMTVDNLPLKRICIASRVKLRYVLPVPMNPIRNVRRWLGCCNTLN